LFKAVLAVPNAKSHASFGFVLHVVYFQLSFCTYRSLPH